MPTKLSIRIVLFAAWLWSGVSSQAQPINEQALRLMQVMNRISNAYVEQVDAATLEEDAIRCLLQKLDPHSTFVKKADADRQQDRLNGSYVGIGVYYTFVNDTPTVLKPLVGSPAYLAGLAPGDRLVRVDSQPVVGPQMNHTELSQLLRGPEGSSVRLAFMRQGTAGLMEQHLERARIKDRSIDAALTLSPTVGYVRLARFSTTTFDELNMALLEFRQLGIDDLILDLRDNGGGYLNSVVRIANHFLSEGQLIVYTKGDNSPKKTYLADNEGLWKHGRVVVLVNEASASASEILAGAIQDWDRGLIIGRRTFGKGLVQNTYTLNGGDMLRLTIAKYYTPSGRLIQKPYGVGYEDYGNELVHRYNTGELTHADSVHFPHTEKYHTKNNHRVVYAGGGIMPDLFVPLDTLQYPSFYYQLMRKGSLYEHLDAYYLKSYRRMTQEYPTFEAFERGYRAPADLIGTLKQASPYPRANANAQQEAAMQLHIKAWMARHRWSSKEYFLILATGDSHIQKAIEVLQNPQLYDNKLTAAK